MWSDIDVLVSVFTWILKRLSEEIMWSGVSPRGQSLGSGLVWLEVIK